MEISARGVAQNLVNPMEGSARDVEVGQNLVDPGTNPDPDEKQCWICLQSGGDQLIAPCRCTGSMKWVHRACLNKWRVDSANPRNFTHCRHCNFQFRMVLNRDPSAEQDVTAVRKRRFLLKTVKNVLVIGALVQICLILTALLLRVLDPNEELVTLFHLPQVDESPDPGTGDLLNAFRYHKGTYYLAACLVGLFFTGVLGTLACCIQVCGCDCSCDPCPRSTGAGHYQPDFWDYYMCNICCRDCCEWCGDCCFFAGRGTGPGSGCPDCNPSGTCVGDCCSDCPNCSGGDCGEICNGGSSGGEGGGDGVAGMLMVILGVIVIAFILVGLIVVFAAMVMYAQKVFTRYMQISELRQLTGEYVVEDLANVSLPSPAESGAKALMEASAPPEQAVLEPSAPPQIAMGPTVSHPMTDASTINQSLMRDLQAVYGRPVFLD